MLRHHHRVLRELDRLLHRDGRLSLHLELWVASELTVEEVLGLSCEQRLLHGLLGQLRVGCKEGLGADDGLLKLVALNVVHGGCLEVLRRLVGKHGRFGCGSLLELLGSGGLLGGEQVVNFLQSIVQLGILIMLLLELLRGLGSTGLLELLHDTLALVSVGDASLGVVEKVSQLVELLERGVIGLEGDEEGDAKTTAEDKGGKLNDFGHVLFALGLGDRMIPLGLVDVSEHFEVGVLRFTLLNPIL